MAEHTPTPWTVDKVHFSGECHLHGPNGEEFALLYVSDGADDPEPYPAEANAAFIVKAVNNHGALVKALTDLSNMYSHAWDSVDGNLLMLGPSIDRFEKAHHAAQVALCAVTGAPLPISDEDLDADVSGTGKGVSNG
ncbi:hypothetical protein ABIE93_005996 [Bradyrhizobium elkanii]|uniref:hypothetical protein n=1 Tax=Bradyrhizobium elkanii TaxID=29448 RepID=UPI00351879CB